VWLALNREGIEVARCTVERLMADLGLTGATRGKAKRSTVAAPGDRRRRGRPGRAGAGRPRAAPDWSAGPPTGCGWLT